MFEFLFGVLAVVVLVLLFPVQAMMAIVALENYGPRFRAWVSSLVQKVRNWKPSHRD